MLCRNARIVATNKKGGNRSCHPSKILQSSFRGDASASNSESRDSGSGANAPSRNDNRLRSAGLAEQLVDIVPVDEAVDERLQIVRTAVAVVDVVGVLPDVDAEDRGRAMDQRVLAARRLRDLELAALDLQPGPAGTELADAGGGKVGLELLEAAEVLGDLLFQTAGQLAAAAIRLHPLPEVEVIVVLAGIVEDGRVLAERALHDLLEGLAFEFGPLDRVVAVRDIGLVMLAVVKFQRFLGHVGRKGVVGIGQIG